MIARDEAPAIARALDSARRHVDRMIVLDTGSVDETPAIAAATGRRSTPSTWVDDFAARAQRRARPLRRRLEPGAGRRRMDRRRDEALGALPRAGEARAWCAWTTRRHARQEAASSWLPRLLPRGVRYEGRVHEQPVGGAGQRAHGPVLGHDGYTAANLERKAGRNEALLMAELGERPRTATSGTSSPGSTRSAAGPRRRRSVSPRPCGWRPLTSPGATAWWCARSPR
jgi:glycosyltransferase involved in cell wall biosynthesis